MFWNTAQVAVCKTAAYPGAWPAFGSCCAYSRRHCLSRGTSLCVSVFSESALFHYVLNIGGVSYVYVYEVSVCINGKIKMKIFFKKGLLCINTIERIKYSGSVCLYCFGF